MKKAIATRLFCRSGLRRLMHRTCQWSGVLGFNYHRIGMAQDSVFDRGLWSADADAFAEQMRFCARHLDVISPADLPQVLAAKRGRHVLISFDDGYRDNYDTAFPILQREGVAATFFIASGFIDAPRLPWWDEIAWMVRSSRRDQLQLPPWLAAPVYFDEPHREAAVRALLRAYKTMPTDATAGYLDAIAVAAGTGRCALDQGRQLWMTWDMLREMKAAGMTIAGHTVSHQVLARMSREDQQREIMGCGRRLADELGDPMRYFSYPVGNASAFSTTTRDTLRQAGVSYGFSYYGGFRRFDDWDDYDVRRVAVESNMDRDWFRSIATAPQLFA